MTYIICKSFCLLYSILNYLYLNSVSHTFNYIRIRLFIISLSYDTKIKHGKLCVKYRVIFIQLQSIWNICGFQEIGWTKKIHDSFKDDLYFVKDLLWWTFKVKYCNWKLKKAIIIREKSDKRKRKLLLLYVEGTFFCCDSITFYRAKNDINAKCLNAYAPKITQNNQYHSRPKKRLIDISIRG